MPQTGATRYQKFLKSDKAKTKLKSKKDLPKGTNVTKTNFKVKKIVLKEQLKKHEENEALSLRKLSVKELLTRLNHFNVQSRTAALNGIVELITSHPHSLNNNLGPLIHGVTPLLLNIEKLIRRETIKVLHLIISKSSLEKVEPFYDFMSTYLRSAMTHIDINIQEDSLLFLDSLLQTSGRIAQDFHKIIPNFLDMISKLRIDSKPGRSLTVNLGSQVTTVRWRVKVLQRLQHFLLKFVTYNNIADTEKEQIPANYFDVSKENYNNIVVSTYTALCPVSCLTPQDIESNSDEVEQFQNYIETLMPLLVETWLEVCPTANSDKSTETVISEDAATLLKHILEVISLIWSIVSYLSKKHTTSNILSTFCQKYKQSFNEHIFDAFPYVTNIRSKRTKEVNLTQLEVITDPKLLLQNLEICHLFITLNPNVQVKTQGSQIKLLLGYIEKVVGQQNNKEIQDIIIKVLNSLFSENITNWNKNVTILESLLKKLINIYFNNTNSIPRDTIFVLMCRISLSNKYSHFQTTTMYMDWIKALPDILLGESLSVQTIDTLHKFAVQNNQLFNEVIKSKLFEIVKNMPHLKVASGGSLFKLYSVLYWIKCWDDDSLNLLEAQLLDNVYGNEATKYIFDTLKLRSCA